jgi:hypothetical protein
MKDMRVLLLLLIEMKVIEAMKDMTLLLLLLKEMKVIEAMKGLRVCGVDRDEGD